MTGCSIETDDLVKTDLPMDRLWSAQSRRSLQYFAIGPDLTPSDKKVVPGIVVVGGDAAGLQSTGYRARSAGNRVRRVSDPVASGFLATVLAMAGHDPRQPLQIIRGAHDILGKLLDRAGGREELDQAAEATARLGPGWTTAYRCWGCGAAQRRRGTRPCEPSSIGATAF
jgi:hypothetical protein